MSTIEILVPYPKCNKYSFELSKLTQTRTLEKHFFPSTRRRQKSVKCLHSCTDSLPIQSDRKKCFSWASLLVNFPDSKEFLYHFTQRAYFYMIELHFWLLVLLSHINMDEPNWFILLSMKPAWVTWYGMGPTSVT